MNKEEKAAEAAWGAANAAWKLGFAIANAERQERAVSEAYVEKLAFERLAVLEAAAESAHAAWQLAKQEPKK